MARNPGSSVNQSGKFLGLDAEDNIVEGEANPAMVVLLAVPGGPVPGDIVERYGLADRLRAPEGGTPGTQETAKPEPAVLAPEPPATEAPAAAAETATPPVGGGAETATPRGVADDEGVGFGSRPRGGRR